MNLPKVAAKVPTRVKVEAGKRYALCTCGLSDNQPYCNGAHKGSAYTPNIVVATESKDIWFCQCKHTSNPNGFCDGSHKAIS
ncbi:MAG: CDGSH iron-sulfur domain-containing protein [Bacteroidota bacterium]